MTDRQSILAQIWTKARQCKLSYHCEECSDKLTQKVKICLFFGFPRRQTGTRFSLAMAKSKAFTLAEVLITLGIIGVVAAMTIPTLVTNQQKQASATRLAKVYSIINQAFLNAVVEQGQSQSWGTPPIEWDGPSSNSWWNTYFLPYAKFSVAKSCPSSNGNISTNVVDCQITGIKFLDGSADTSGAFLCSCGGCYVLNDGTTLNFSGVGNANADIYVDITGKSGPNIWGKDIFLIRLGYGAGNVYLYGKGNSRTTLLSNNTYMCNKQSGTYKGKYCGALIQMDGWKIADDYPW